MDFAKAFDKVPHRRLAYKLEYYGTRNDILQWITTWLSGRTQKVVVDGISPCVVWCPPGFRIRSHSFSDIYKWPSRQHKFNRPPFFADGCVFYRNIRRSKDQHILQDDLNKLAQWEEAWLRKFNVAKYHSMRVTKHHLPKQVIHDYSLHNQVLENVPLGITVTDDLDWGQRINNITSKATKTLSFLRRNLTLALKETKVAAYKALVRPQLEYAAPIWNPYHQTEINRTEKVQRTAARWACRRRRNQSHAREMLEELQWPELQERRQ